MNNNTALIALGFHTLDIADMPNTIENDLARVREDLILYKARDTIRRTGWFFTEPVYE